MSSLGIVRKHWKRTKNMGKRKTRVSNNAVRRYCFVPFYTPCPRSKCVFRRFTAIVKRFTGRARNISSEVCTLPRRNKNRNTHWDARHIWSTLCRVLFGICVLFIPRPRHSCISRYRFNGTSRAATFSVLIIVVVTGVYNKSAIPHVTDTLDAIRIAKC